MWFNTIKALWYRNLLNTLRDHPDAFSIIFWPLVTVLSFSLFASFIGDPVVFTVLLLGAMIWRYEFTAHQDASFTFIRDMWERSLKRLRLIPTNSFTVIFGNWTYGILRSSVTLLLMGTIVSAFGFFNIFSANLLQLVVILFGLNLFGLFIGLIVSSGVLKFGQSGQVLVWSMSDIFVLISGVFYPVSILPESIRWITMLSPVTYAMENLRGMFLNGTFDISLLIYMYLLLGVYLAIAWIIFSRQERKARERGFFQRYE